MNRGRNISFFFFNDTFGAVATANLLLCAVSGIFLAIPFRVDQPYESIGILLITNPWGTLFRNIHYWSGQLFLIFTILHTWDYIKRPQEIDQPRGVWFRLILSILATLFVMLSGFILKGDADSLQARRIFESLISGIPLAGKVLVHSLFGQEGTFQLVYIHHIATATIFLFIVLFEHARKIWVKPLTFLVVLLVVSLFGFLFQAPLHNNLHQVVKGPWYLVGLQEILHWMKHPSRILLLLLVLLILLYYLPGIKKYSVPGKRIILYSFYAYLVLTLIGYFFRGENWQLIWPWEKGYATQVYLPFKPDPIRLKSDFTSMQKEKVPLVLGRAESCLVCHDQMQGFSASHDPRAIGCVACHGGNSFSLNKQSAHAGMDVIPGNLQDAPLRCGSARCHPRIPFRVNRSIMTTLSGMVSVDRFVFGENPAISTLSNINELRQSPADNHLRDLCAACHLGNKKREAGPISETTRGGGCNACHLNYSELALSSMKKYHNAEKTDSTLPLFHPQLSLHITNRHCFGCHSRSGRIATSYEGWHETLLTGAEVAGKTEYRILEDKRIYRYIAEDVHHQKGLECIDCHVSYELMGDGNVYHHKEQQVKIRCEDCHFASSPMLQSLDGLDQETKTIMEVRKFYPVRGKVLLGKVSGVSYPNTGINTNDSLYLVSKNSGKIHPLPSPSGNACAEGAAHSRISCSGCHTAWAPRCIGCHTLYEPSSTGYDLYENRFTRGAWVEFAGKYLAVAPTLGVEEGKKTRIRTAIPGMILTIDKRDYPGYDDSEPSIFHRLYAPIEAHTIQKKGRSCSSCHQDPVTLGYGEGLLEYQIMNGKGYWRFKPRYANNKQDDLPADAWIGFLKQRDELTSTRENFRPFNLPEQQKILTVGACLTCHEDDSPIMQESLSDFQSLLHQVSSYCILPSWDE